MTDNFQTLICDRSMPSEPRQEPGSNMHKKSFRNFESRRYIHRITKAHADSGLELEMLKQMVFVQIDKALDLYLTHNYNEDEDVELLELFAFIADVNNESIINKAQNNNLLSAIREDVFKFTRDKEVQSMILAEDLAIMDWNSNMRFAREEGEAKIVALNKWLVSQGRTNDILQYTEDPAYLNTLLAEYDAAKAMPQA